MSLDLYIMSKTPVRKRGTGVYVRDAGRTRELETLEEVKRYFPEADLSSVHEVEYETTDLWSGNITHNLGEMASHVPIGDKSLYDYLWRPEEHGFDVVNADYALGVYAGFVYVKTHKEELLPYTPEPSSLTGRPWGTYDVLLGFCESLADSLTHLDYQKEEYKLHASR